MMFSFLNNSYRKTAYKLAVGIVFMLFPAVFLGFQPTKSQNKNEIVSLEPANKLFAQSITSTMRQSSNFDAYTIFNATRVDGTKELLALDLVSKKDRLASKKSSLWFGLGSCLVASATILTGIFNRNFFLSPYPSRNVIGLLGFSVSALGIWGTYYFKKKYNSEKSWLDKRKDENPGTKKLIESLSSSNKKINDRFCDVLPEETLLVRDSFSSKKSVQIEKQHPKKDIPSQAGTVIDSFYDVEIKKNIEELSPIIEPVKNIYMDDTWLGSSEDEGEQKRVALHAYVSVSKTPISTKMLEDRWSANMLDDGGWLYGVYDGHGGGFSAKFCMRYLPEYINVALEKLSSSTDQSFQCPHKSYALAFAFAFYEVHRKITKLQSTKTFSKHMYAGTTASVAYIKGKHLYMINAGDSRVVLCSKNGKVRLATKDHHPGRKKERARILQAVGTRNIEICKFVNGMALRYDHGSHSMISRSIGGELNWKDLVIPYPEVYAIELTDDDNFLLLASDGVFGKRIKAKHYGSYVEQISVPGLTNDDACRLVSDFLQQKPEDFASAADHLCREARKIEGNCDDITVMIVPLKNGKVIKP